MAGGGTSSPIVRWRTHRCALEDSPAERMPFEPLLIRAPPNMSSARAVPGAFNLYETFKEGRFKADGEEESPPRSEFPSPSTLRVCAGR